MVDFYKTWKVCLPIKNKSWSIITLNNYLVPGWKLKHNSHKINDNTSIPTNLPTYFNVGIIKLVRILPL